MIDSVLNLLFRCSHRRLTRPVTPARKGNEGDSETYVVCLDCGKQFAYDLNQMRIGKAIARRYGTGVVPPNLPKPRKAKWNVALVAALPLAAFLGARFKSRKVKSSPVTEEPAQAGDE